ncbi:GNAT family N-acetyltransferase [Legionella feeleii]|uniref:Acyl-CoA N-acyltransferase n=1 Tax=Legionella feeleii TaxID=453 RepID=A0A378KK63_9GAMM|nr:N-acetyltransferase [Legionella feeleii]STX88286.1 acyl-CoA N-acyltransferase [Legionella feeleii]
MEIRRLTKADWRLWRSIRLSALKDSPDSFCSTFEEEVKWKRSDFQRLLINNHLIGIFIDEVLASCAGLYLSNSPRQNHRGIVWGIYTRPEYRMRGLATLLLQTLISQAKRKVVQLHLTCIVNNKAAVSFYQKLGFKIYGTEPRAMKIDDVFFDAHLMVLELL